MGIITYYRKEIKRTRIKKTRESDKEVISELQLIMQKKSNLSSRERRAIILRAREIGIKTEALNV